MIFWYRESDRRTRRAFWAGILPAAGQHIPHRFVRQGGIWKVRGMCIPPMMKADYRTGWGKGGIGAPPPPFLEPGPRHAAGLADLRRRYQRSLAYEETMNVSAAYGYYLDDFQWPAMSGIFAIRGNKQSSFAGYYFGRDRIAAAATAMRGKTPHWRSAMRAAISFHWRT